MQEVDVGGYRLDIECEGQGSPTVVFEAGAGGDRTAFLNQWVDVRDITRVCAYDRAGIGTSDERPAAGSIALGDLADELARLLDGAGIEGPVVLASHSLGGGVAQFFADRYPDRVTGLVFVDTVAIPGFVDWFGPSVDDGTGGSIDMRRTAEEWERLGSLGSTPTIVLTQGFAGEDASAPQRFRRYFRGVHDELAGRSSDSVHVIAEDSGHISRRTPRTSSRRRSPRSSRPSGRVRGSRPATGASRRWAGPAPEPRGPILAPAAVTLVAMKRRRHPALGAALPRAEPAVPVVVAGRPRPARVQLERDRHLSALRAGPGERRAASPDRRPGRTHRGDAHAGRDRRRLVPRRHR